VYWNRIGGIATYTRRLTECLRAGYPCDRYHLFAPVAAPAVELGGTPVIVASMIPSSGYNRPAASTPRAWDREAAALDEAIQDHDLDVYHVPQNGIGVPARSDCPLVITLLDVIPITAPRFAHARYVEVFNERVPRASARADAVITPSEFSKQDIRRTLAVPEEKIRVIPLAAADIFRPIDHHVAIAHVAARYQIEGDYLFYAGGCNARKNVTTLIESFARAVGGLPRSTRLMLACKAAEVPDVVSRTIARLGLEGRVVFLGRPPTEDLPYLYNAARLFVFLSLYEGFGLPPLESLACGVPAIVAGTTALPEVVDDGAVLVDPGDPVRISECILELFHDETLRRVMSARGRARSRLFSWERTATMTRHLYREVAG
jgi:glycosyltransferase involved in cell wall biosynthesis